jgi:hypothetical protein
MSECVSLIIWPNIANYYLISLWFYVQCRKLQKCCNGILILKRAYLHSHWFKLCEIKFIRKPKRSIVLFLYNAKCNFHSIKCHTAYNLKLQNIAMLLEPTVRGMVKHSYVNCSGFTCRLSCMWVVTCTHKWHVLTINNTSVVFTHIVPLSFVFTTL